MSGTEGMDVNAAFRRLRALDKDLQARKINKDDRATMLISACISEGFTAGRQITGALAAIGLNRRHAGMRLMAGLQDEPVWPNWGRREDGTYYVPERRSPEV